MWRYSWWIYAAIAAGLLIYGLWQVTGAVWATESVVARSALVLALTSALLLAGRDLKRRRLGVFTGLVWLVWMAVTLLVLLFGDLYMYLTQP